MKYATEKQINEQKTISLVNIEGNVWDIKFEGLISRADMSRITRLLTVQFAVIQRQRSIDRRTTQIRAVKNTEPVEPVVTKNNSENKDPVKETINVPAIYKP